MILAGQLLLEASADRCEIRPGWIRIEGDTIQEVVVGEVPSTADLGGPQFLISPGFIDTHLHLPQFDSIGAHGLSLLEWLDRVIFPAEGRWDSADLARGMTRRVLSQCLAHGTTAICAYATVHAEATEAALEEAHSLGFRGVIGQVLMDRNAPQSLCREASELIDQTACLLDRFPPGGRIAAAVTPRFAISCSESLLSAAGTLASQREAVVQTHLAESVAECEWVSELFGGLSYVDVYRQAGLLGPRSILGHGVHLNDVDRTTLATTGSVIAHCPTANAFLLAGTMNRSRLVNDRVALALGSDIGAGFERSMVRVARSMILAAASLGGAQPSAAEAWYAITAGNADRLGWHNAGRLRVETAADLVVIEPTIPWLSSDVDPLAMLMFAWDDRWLHSTWIRGRRVH